MKTKSISIRILISLVFSIILLNCNSKESGMDTIQYSSNEHSLEDQGETNTETNSENSLNPIDRKLIKDGQIEFETEDISSDRQLILESCNKYKGYISSDREYKSNDHLSNTIVVRVPAKNFDPLINDITKGVAKFEVKNIEVKDVTEEFLDVEARLKTKKELEKRYLDLLNKTNNVTEILEVEKEIGALRSEIESIEGRLNFLNDNVSLSTLSITLYESLPHDTEFAKKFKEGFYNGWDNLTWFFILLTNIWPFVLIGTILIYIIRYLMKKRKLRKKRLNKD